MAQQQAMVKMEGGSTVYLPQSLEGLLVDISTVVPNTWNPNKMEVGMRAKLVRAIMTDGYTQPIIVRNLPAARRAELPGVLYEIIDGEHRWAVSGAELELARVPVVNLGDVPDAAAKQITIKANALRGEFDSIKLAEMLKNLSDEVSIDALVESLPYQKERIESLIDLLNFSAGDTSTLIGRLDGEGQEKQKRDRKGKLAATQAGGEGGENFKSFRPEDLQFECKCPRCGYEFNNK